jgi:hypothetical protein
MRTLHSFEDMAGLRDSGLYVPEAYDGTKIVQWYGNIERQLTRMLEENEAARNFVYADKLRTYLKTWRENEITGSMNRETLQILKAATEQLAVEPWNLGNYFSNLRDQIRKLVASEEQLPRVATEPGEKMAGPGAGAPSGATPPLAPEFGPEEKPPGMGGAEAGGPTPEEGGPEEPRPGEEAEKENLPTPEEIAGIGQPAGSPKLPRRPPRG